MTSSELPANKLLILPTITDDDALDQAISWLNSILDIDPDARTEDDWALLDALSDAIEDAEDRLLEPPLGRKGLI